MRHRLLVNPGTPQSWEIQLKPGTNRIGRTEDNDHQINHPSISSSHCEILVSDEGVTLLDLGSTNGTFVNRAPVQEAMLQTGQHVQLGNVEMIFEISDPGEGEIVGTMAQPSAPTHLALPHLQTSSEAPPVPKDFLPLAPPIPVPVPVPTTATAYCKFHPKSLAQYRCPKCNRAFCELCVSTRPAGGVIRKMCRTCAVECAPVKISASQRVPPSKTFASGVKGAFAYPLRGDGAILLTAGTVFYLLMDAAKFLAGFAPIYGLMALGFLTVFGTGYLVCYLRRILTSSAWGEDKMPDWPDITDFSSDILSPFLQLLATVVVCFAPAFLLIAFVAADNAWAGWSILAGVLFGCALFPMAFLAVAMFDTIGALNPLLIVPAILKIPLQYLLTIGIFIAILAVRWAGEVFFPQYIPIPFLSTIIFSFVGLYLLTVEMRILGVLYAVNKHKLGWFSR